MAENKSTDTYEIPGLLGRVRWWITHPWQLILRIVSEIYKIYRPEEPWISHYAVRFCAKNLKTNMKGLELGSGRSTLWFAKHLGHLVSVEHDANWYEIVNKKIKDSNIKNIEYRYIPLDHPATAPTFREYEKLPAYVQTIHTFQESSLDFVVVDGHYRLACIQAVLKKIRPGGLLLLDNSNWMQLSDWGVPADWPILHRSTGFESETTVWQKPK